MKQAITPAYTFTPGPKTLDLSAISGFDIKRLLGVLNVTTGAILYAAGMAGFGYSALSSATLTLVASTAGMNATDKLVILYDDGGETRIGEVGGNSAVVAASVTRPANTTAYAAGQLLANSTTAGSVAPLSLAAARKAAGTGIIRRARLKKSGTSITNASFRVHLYKDSPTVASGDGAAISTSESNYLGMIDVVMDRSFTDGAKGIGVPSIGAEMLFDAAAGSQNVYALIEARAAYTPTSGEVFTLALEVMRD